MKPSSPVDSPWASGPSISVKIALSFHQPNFPQAQSGVCRLRNVLACTPAAAATVHPRGTPGVVELSSGIQAMTLMLTASSRRVPPLLRLLPLRLRRLLAGSRPARPAASWSLVLAPRPPSPAASL